MQASIAVNPLPNSEPRITEATLSTELDKTDRLDPLGTSAEMDRIAVKQPHLFDMILMQKSLGATLETMDCLLEILRVSCGVADSAGLSVPEISDEKMISELNRFVEEVGFASKLPAPVLTESVVQYRSNHPEPVLLRWALQKLSEVGLTDFSTDQKNALLAGCTIVNCISRSGGH